MSMFHRMHSSKSPDKTIPALPWKRCIAKSTGDGQPGISVLEHCRNVGEVARALIAVFPDCLSNLIPREAPIVAAVHDMGKVSPGYLQKHFMDYLTRVLPDLAQHGGGFEKKHAEVSEAAVVDSGSLAAASIGEVVGSHHGIRSRAPLKHDAEIYGGDSWAKERRALLSRLLELFGPLPSERLSPHERNLLAGLVCVADWIGSDETFFPSDKTGDACDPSAAAARAVRECGWFTPEFVPGLTFKEIFDNEPYDVQSAFIGAVSEPGLYVLEAPMGSGKTEAALYAIYKLMRSGCHHGFYFGLPTRLTSDRIHARVQKFLERICRSHRDARLAHGMAWLSRVGGEELRGGGGWFAPSKRALLYPFAVGTVDQALLSVLRVKHFFVRTFGLAGKVVILDEIHSYDVYTGTLLNHLVKTLLDIGCTVIILSATLTETRRRQIFPIEQAPLGNDYPMISWYTTTGISGLKEAPTPPAGTVEIALEDPSDEEVAQLAVERAGNGQCVVCIANTVAQAQEWYKQIKSSMRENLFPVGLLHSRFPAWRRKDLEDAWMKCLGKDGPRPDGCVLIGTQVLEQSIDIDADFMITELAPSDMLLQRIGRLWRHARDNRPCDSAAVHIVIARLEKAEDESELIELLGKSNTRVYSPYVLWKTYQIWKWRVALKLPNDIRDILERTYHRDPESEPGFVVSLFEKLEQRREHLRGRAAASLAEVTSMPVQRDDEYAATRYSTYPTVDVLLVRSLNSTGEGTRIVLLDGSQVKVSERQRNFEASKLLHANLVSLPAYHFDRVETPMHLRMHFYGRTPVLVLETDRLLLDGCFTIWGYTPELGVFRSEPNVGKQIAGQEDDDEFDW